MLRRKTQLGCSSSSRQTCTTRGAAGAAQRAQGDSLAKTAEAQLIAKAAGGVVERGPIFEIGFHEVELTDGPPIDITLDTIPAYTQLPTAVLDTQATA